MNREMRRQWAKKLRQWRKDARISQEELARRTGLSTKTISDLELEKTAPDQDTVLRYAEGLGRELKATDLRDFWPDHVREYADVFGLTLMRLETEAEQHDVGDKTIAYLLRLSHDESAE